MDHISQEKTIISSIVVVGHCGFDSPGLRRWVKKTLPDVEVAVVNRQAQLAPFLNGQSLLLINRVLDGRFDRRSGLDMIQDLGTQNDPPRMMLISNYPEAQAEAQAVGARPGVGKKQLKTAEAKERLIQAAA